MGNDPFHAGLAVSAVAAQARYTSCPDGLSGRAGFQFAAASPGLRGEVLRALERVVLYQPPLDAPAEPSEAEIARFPVSFSLNRLQTGQLAMVRSTYVGRDYSGRFGNFRSHAVVLSDESDLRAAPIAYRRARFWSDGGGEGDDRSLPELALDDPPPPLDLSAALRTLRAPKRVERVGVFATGVELALAGERRVILVDDAEAAAHWLAAVAATLPLELARRLTFTTYDRAPRRADTLVAATTGGGELDVAPYELSSQLVVVDAVGGGADSLGVLDPSLLGRVLEALVATGDSEAIETFASETAARIEGVLDVADLGPALALHVPNAVELTASDLVAILGMLVGRPRSAIGSTLLGWVFDDLAASASAADAVAAGLRAGAHAAGAPTADALFELGYAWLVAATEIDPAIVEALDVAPPVPERAHGAWADRLAAAEGDELAAALRVGAAIGALAPRSLPEAVHARLERLVREDPASTAAKASLQALPEPDGEHLLRVGLRAVSEDRGRAAAFAGLMADPQLKGLLRRVARAPADYREAVGSAAVALASGAADAERMLSYLIEHARSDGDAREAVVVCLGPGDPLDPLAAGTILSAGEGRDLPWAGVLERVERALFAAGSLERPRPELAELVKRARSFHALARRPVLWAHDLARSRPRDPRAAAQWLEQVDRIRAALPLELAAELEALSAGVALGLEASELRALLQDSRGRSDPWLYRRCCSVIHTELGANRPAPLAARWFEACVDRGAGGDESAVRVFDETVGRWSAKEREKVQRALGRESRDAWRRWSEAHPAPRGLLSRTLGFMAGADRQERG